MDIAKIIFCRKKADSGKLSAYDFIKEGDGFSYSTFLKGSGFELRLFIDSQGVQTTLIDPDFNEAYTSHLVANATGSFVIGVRNEYEQILREIADKCFEPDVFKSEQARRLIEYVHRQYGEKLEFLWEKSPDNAILRRSDTSKWYAALLTIPSHKLGVTPDRIVEVIDLRLHPDKMAGLIDKERYFPGWHMNKKSWYTIIMDDSVPFEELCQRVEESRQLAIK